MPVAVQAQPVNGLYVGAGAGVNFKQDQDFDSFNANVGPLAPAATNGLGLKPEYSSTVGLGVASVGYGLGNGLRLEVEGNSRQNRCGHLHGTLSRPHPAATAIPMARWSMRCMTSTSRRIPGITWMYPYVGVGAGYAWTTFHNAHSYGTNFPFFWKTNDTDGNFAYQAISVRRSRSSRCPACRSRPSIASSA